MIENRYQPSAVEARIYAAWEEAGAFRAGRRERAKAEPYCVVIPPPNVTGSLHMGHALNNTLQDILCRFERMRGKDVLWQPGTDHAGIATQAVVERQLAERKEPSSREMGREAFIKRVWEWKAESGGTIISQLKRLGASCDWSRERFTMGERGDPNDQMVRAVTKVFVDLYNEKLIYRDKRLVNWDPKLKTAISDLEVVQVECKGSFKWSSDSDEPLSIVQLAKILNRNPNGHLYYIRYPIDGRIFDVSNVDTFVVVATTRPETMLGDAAVAIHPQNDRLKHLIGKNLILPLVHRQIPIVGDEYADPEKGTGAVKITPAHDFNDFEVGKRHQLPMRNIFTVEGKLKASDFDDMGFGHRGTDPRYPDIVSADEDVVGESVYQLIPAVLRGLDRFQARWQIVEMLNAEDVLEKIEPHAHAVPYGDRSNVVIEPFLTEQWYANAKELAKPAIAAVRAGKTTFIPQNWENTYFNWMENIQPWCISRQLWWGHQIPAWYGPDGYPFVAETEEAAYEAARVHYIATGSISEQDYAVLVEQPVFSEWLKRDEDVLDTWFSSALWPFSTLGWPDETPELNRFYPTSALVTGFDIIFFWVARMMMMGLHFRKDVPFHDVYIHRLVRDASGAKMSKSKGNVVDPLGVIDQYGADALRFALARGAAQGHDIRLGPQDVENNRNFATKLWNAARFAEMNECFIVSDFNPASVKELINQWIVSELSDTLGKIELALSDYRFNDAANAIYHFVWDLYCDWYLELTKPIFVTPQLSDAAKRETRATVAYIRDQILRVLHPFMPFVTEELWRVTENDRQETMLALAAWPGQQPHFMAAHEEVGWLIELVTAVRSVRTEMNIPGSSLIQIEFVNPSEATRKRAEIWDSSFNRLARISGSIFSDRVQPGSIQLIVGGEVVALPLKGVIDLAAEAARLTKELAKADADIARVDAKLGNPNFVARAPQEVVEEEQEKRAEAQARKAKIVEALERLKDAT